MGDNIKIDRSVSGYEQVDETCERDTETSNSVKSREFREYLKYC